MLVSKGTISKLGLKIDFTWHEAEVNGQVIKLQCDYSGNYCATLTTLATESCNVVFHLTNLLELNHEEEKTKAIKLHRQLCYASKDRLVKLLKDSGCNDKTFLRWQLIVAIILFLALHFFYYTLMTFLTMLSVIMLSTLMILLSILSVIMVSDLWQQLESASELESDLRDIVDWGKKWFVDFNAGKTQLVCFDRSNNNVSIDVKMDGSVLEGKISFLRCWDLLF